MPISYNGLDLSAYAYTESVEQTNQLDESGTDRQFTVFLLRTSSIIDPALVPSNPGETPEQTMRRIEHLLLQPRRPLTYQGPAGGLLIDLPSGLDDANGPLPLYARCSAITAANWRLEFAVECRIGGCGGSPPGQGWLSHRWSDTCEYDQNWGETRRRQGTLVLSSRAGTDPEDYRGLVTPEIPKGFKRIGGTYTLDANNLRVRYSFTDRQMHRSPPWPATGMKFRQSESVPTAGGLRQGEVHIRLDGPPGVNPRDLMKGAIRIAVARALAAGVVVAKKANRMLIGGTITEIGDDDSTAVECSIAFKAKATSSQERGNADDIGKIIAGALTGALPALTGAANDLTNPPVPNAQGRDQAALQIEYANWLGAELKGTDPERAIAPPLFGVGAAAAVRILAAALGDPCGQTIELRQGPTVNEWVGVSDEGDATLTANRARVEPPDDTEALYTDDGPGVYESFQVTSHVIRDPGVQLLSSTKAGEKAQFTQMHEPEVRMEVHWTASRVGGPPTYPDPNPTSQNVELLDSVISPEHIDLAADGVSPRYTVSGVYKYQLYDHKLATVTASVPPWLDWDVQKDAMALATRAGQDIIFPDGGNVVNPWTGEGVTPVSRSGTSQLVGNPRP